MNETEFAQFATDLETRERNYIIRRVKSRLITLTKDRGVKSDPDVIQVSMSCPRSTGDVRFAVTAIVRDGWGCPHKETIRHRSADWVLAFLEDYLGSEHRAEFALSMLFE